MMVAGGAAAVGAAEAKEESEWAAETRETSTRSVNFASKCNGEL